VLELKKLDETARKRINPFLFQKMQGSFAVIRSVERTGKQIVKTRKTHMKPVTLR